MSKKMRKKSSKLGAGNAARAIAAGRKTTTGKTRRAVPVAANAKPETSPAKRPSESSRKGVAKPLKASSSRSPVKTARPKTAANKTAAKPLPSDTVLAEGSKAPAFNLPRDGGTRVTLSDFSGRKLVIFFYPRASTPGCTREAMDFTRLANDFAACGTALLGVSADPVKAQESFRTKYKLSMPLISDETHGMLEAYGAWGEKSMYGRTFLGVIRTTILVSAEGRIKRVWRGVRVDGHADEVLAAAQSL